MGGLAYSWVLGRRKQSQLMNFRPHNVSLVVLGTFMLWFGWLGFNAGSAFGANLRAVTAAWNSNITAAFVSKSICLIQRMLKITHHRVGLHGVCLISAWSASIPWLVSVLVPLLVSSLRHLLPGTSRCGGVLSLVL